MEGESLEEKSVQAEVEFVNQAGLIDKVNHRW
jgi:hypothetical protein